MEEGIFSEQIQANFNKYFPYLLEVRKRLMFIVAIFVVSGLIGFFYFERIITTILGLLNFTGVNIVFTTPFQFFTLAINSGMLLGIVFAFPLIVYQILSFIKPALTKKEYRIISSMIPVTLILFAGGFLYGVGIMKYVVALFYQKSVELNIGNLLDINLLLSKIILTGILMGASFQFPVVMTALMRLKIIRYNDFIKQRAIAYSVSVIFAAFLPPTDVLSLILLTFPLIFLFELTLILNKIVLKAHLK
jgi:sec-independent protein translocase protein TatC